MLIVAVGAWLVHERGLPGAMDSSSSAPGTVRGVVRDGQGAVVGATVIATAVEEGDTLSSRACHCDYDCGVRLLECGCSEAAMQMVQLVTERKGEAPIAARTMSGRGGTFELTGLPRGSFALWVQGKGEAAVEMPVEAGTGGLSVRLAPAREIRGSVVDEDGKPLSGAEVTAVRVDHTRFFDAVSGPDGQFTVAGLPAGAYAVVARSSGLLPDHAPAGEQEAPLSFTLYRARRLRGRVERSGKPVAAAAVVIDGQHHRRHATADATGRFEFTGLRPGDYQLRATAGLDQAELSPEVAAGKDSEVVLSLEAGGEVRGQVSSAADGQPVADARVVIYAGSNDSFALVSGVTDASGAFALGPLPAGSAKLVVRAAGYEGRSEDVEDVPRGGRVTRQLRLTPDTPPGSR